MRVFAEIVSNDEASLAFQIKNSPYLVPAMEGQGWVVVEGLGMSIGLVNMLVWYLLVKSTISSLI